MMNRMLVLFLALVGLVHVAAECPNACSSHGKCGDYDSCECYRNWMSNDCSERVCQFGLAHVDTPKGDLDASSGMLMAPGVADTAADEAAQSVISGDAIYKYGTTEQFPAMRDSLSVVMDNTAHYYMECSNKGVCDRDAGECTCFDGYEGSACQRASCPATKAGVCSGHGTCRSIFNIAADDAGNHYNLWDQDSTLGCDCDAGYSGPSCADRVCKYGFDPLYYDDEHTVHYSNFTFAILNQGSAATYEGTFALKFYDVYGEDWETAPINIAQVNAASSATTSTACSVIIKALEDIPNDVIPDNSVLCHMTTDQNEAFDDTKALAANRGVATSDQAWEPITAKVPGTLALAVETKFTLAFPGNPGYLKQPEFNLYLDGDRPTLWTNEEASTLTTWVYPNGFQGEDVDYVPDLCENVQVKLVHDDTNKIYNIQMSVGTDTGPMANLFRACLGESDNNPATIAMDTYMWDYGTIENPHLIKLVDTTPYPASPLCPTEDSSLTRYIHSVKGGSWRDAAGVTARLGAGWCVRSKPPGFYAIIYQDKDGKFYMFNRAGDDYPDMAFAETASSAPTLFNVFTTTGTLQVISPHVNAFSHIEAASPDAASYAVDYKTYHTNVVYTYATAESVTEGAHGLDISCEYGDHDYRSQTQLACLEKGDFVFLLNASPVTGDWTGDGVAVTEQWLNNLPSATGGVHDNVWSTVTTNLNSNPKYLNMYRVAKIGREHNYQESTLETDMLLRNKITFEQSLNFRATLPGGTWTDAATGQGFIRLPKIYKFTPPANKIANTYAAECSTRGICNREDGICECFAGYTGDSCNMQNALAE